MFRYFTQVMLCVCYMDLNIGITYNLSTKKKKMESEKLLLRFLCPAL